MNKIEKPEPLEWSKGSGQSVYDPGQKWPKIIELIDSHNDLLDKVEKLERDLMFATRGDIVLTEDVPEPTDDWPTYEVRTLLDEIFQDGLGLYEAEAKLRTLLERKK